VCETLLYFDNSYGYDFMNNTLIFLTYNHIPRSYNHVYDAYANYILDWHLSHKIRKENTFMHVHIVTYISKVEDQIFLYIFHHFKKYGVIVKNRAHTPKIYIWPVYNMTMAYTPMAPDVYHDSTLRRL
jgi:hypothetical protein